MYSIFKYSFISELERKFKNSFKLSNKDGIYVLPPILKNFGIITYVCFPVIKKNKTLVNRPIGIIRVSKNKKIKLYDLFNYDFCLEPNFNKVYYNFESNNFWPNICENNEEFIRICLQDLSKIYSKINPLLTNKKEYNIYLNKIKQFFPKEFFSFYDFLQNNKILKISEETKLLRDKFFTKYEEEEKLKKEEHKIILEKNKKTFLTALKQNISKFIKQEVLPSFIEKGAFYKLLFYNELGKQFKNYYNLNFENCYNPNLSIKELNKNKEDLINKTKVDIIKIYSKVINNNFSNNNNVDTLSRILIVFLNSLLIEENNKTFNKNFEEEISESKDIFEENIALIKNVEVKEILQNFYENLCKDYLENNKNNFSDIFHGYLVCFGNSL